jgi:biotin carboxylase
MEIHDMNCTPYLLVIGSREHTLKKLEELKIDYLLIQSESDSIKEYLDEKTVFVSDYNNIAEIIRIAEQLHQLHRFTAVVSFTEFGLYPAALIAEQLNINGNSVFPVENTRDKLKMRLLLEKHRFAPIMYQNCTTVEEVTAFYKKINTPFILKPINGAGSQGVYYIDSPEQISNAWEWSTQQGAQELIAEEYLPGKEYSVESLSIDGHHQIVAITEKYTSGFPHFIELGHHSPALLNPAMQDKIEQEILRFLDIIEQQHGPAHTEIKVYRNQIKIVESQTRMGGDQIWELTELTTGVDVISETIIHLLGLNKRARVKQTNAAAILFFAREFEEIIDIIGLESAQKHPGIIRVDCTLKKGKQLGKLMSSQSRQGYVLGVGDDVEGAISAVNLAMKQVQIKAKAYSN